MREYLNELLGEYVWVHLQRPAVDPPRYVDGWLTAVSDAALLLTERSDERTSRAVIPLTNVASVVVHTPPTTGERERSEA